MRLFIVSSTLGSRLASARNKAGLSQKELGENIGGSQQQIANIESGKTLHSKYLNPICEHLGVSYDWLVGGEEKTAAPATRDDYGEIVNIASESLQRAMNSVKAINMQKGIDPKTFDEALILRAFKLTLTGDLTGDFVTAALNNENLGKASNSN